MKKKNPNFKSRIHHLTLYPLEDETHKKAIEYVKKNYSYALICHDRDLFDENVVNEEGVVIHHSGEVKKPHTHLVIEFPNQRYRDSVCKGIGVPPHYDMQDNKQMALTYLIHYNNIEKAQYQVEEVQGNLKQWLVEFLNKKFNTEEMNLLDIMMYIDAQKYVNYSFLLKWACKNGYWSSLRRGGTFICKYIDEHNALINIAVDNYEDSLKKYKKILTAEQKLKDQFEDEKLQIKIL